MNKDNIINIGIDLGTSRTVIACDNGVRTYTPSFVGFPKDAVSAKLFGKDMVFGEEAVKHRMAMDLYRPFETLKLKFSDGVKEDNEEYKKAFKAARHILQHMVDKAKESGELYGASNLKIRGVIGAPALASIRNRKAFLDIARGIIDDVMVASEPFCVAYGLGLLTNAFIVDIGAGTVE
ncbi:magnetosome protein MamK, partial [Candidatus Magnetoovum chiemensis]